MFYRNVCVVNGWQTVICQDGRQRFMICLPQSIKGVAELFNATASLVPEDVLYRS